mmetsp:Transcript_13975/g.35241  ORF Transcript_13975/g.35241 Transcript_13975/m.35241 type:complete len:294 (+) Transcript_13975:87-968(+)|eukprot:CAMPEP_0198240342 /NCGR_PEP_ID=MMETSP1446-20131203/5486_1 /TAXON_ID=1461542 ORGANISM="Unidentified sp, Strain CCMP2111" /NCGR_SAMPLE_ID=MMETSP1446 /ASSEMBLY_ACC=CAM_ASM_001112 /LENGTH=293 /DNA_ID=CAMNT_0043923061 /DNA_START=28 /DNA_END=909 /DNA_ORIENTATION=-
MEEDEQMAEAVRRSLQDCQNDDGNKDDDDDASPPPGGEAGGPGEKEGGDARELPERAAKTKEEKEAILKKKLEEIKRKKEEEEKRLDKEREANRIVAGKELSQQQRLLADEERKRLAEFRKREKEENRKAKQKILDEIARDQAERRSRNGGKGLETRQDQGPAKDAGSEKDNIWGAKPISTQTKLREVLVAVKQKYSKEMAETAFRTLGIYVGNLAKDPEAEKFRSIRSTNKAFQQRIACLEGGEGISFLELMGFSKDGETYTLGNTKVNRNLLHAASTELNSALTNPFFGVL